MSVPEQTTPNRSGNVRSVAMDCLRIASCFAVVWLHFSGRRLRLLPIDSPEGFWFQLSSVAAGFAVPCFFMLSGMFFLDPVRKVETKRCLRSAIRLLFLCAAWSLVYAFVPPKPDLRLTVAAFLHGPGHLWFLWSLVGCYLLAPGLRHVAKDRDSERILLIAVFCLTLIPATLRPMSIHFERILPLSSRTAVCSAPLWYFVLGDFIHRASPQPRPRTVFVCGLLGFLGCVLWSKCLGPSPLVNPENAFVAFFSIAVFACFNTWNTNRKTVNKVQLRNLLFVTTVSKSTLGIYLLHGIGLRLMPPFGTGYLSFLAEVFVCFLGCLAATIIFRKTWGLKTLV